MKIFHTVFWDCFWYLETCWSMDEEYFNSHLQLLQLNLSNLFAFLCVKWFQESLWSHSWVICNIFCQTEIKLLSADINVGSAPKEIQFFIFCFNITVTSFFSLDELFVVIHLWTVACCSQSHGMIRLEGTVKRHPAWQNHIHLQRKVTASAWDKVRTFA